MAQHTPQHLPLGIEFNRNFHFAFPATVNIRPFAPAVSIFCISFHPKASPRQENQNREAAAGGESFSRGCEVAGENIGFADTIVGKEAIGSLGIRPVLTCPWGRGPTLPDNCSNICRSRLPWRTSSNSHPTISLSIHSSVRKSVDDFRYSLA